MKTNKKNTGIKVSANVKAGGMPFLGNHNTRGLKVLSNIKAGTFIVQQNHNRRMSALA